MALSRKGKIVIGASAFVLLTIIVIASVFATRKDTPEVTVVKIETRRELRSSVTASGEIRPIQFINLTSEVQGRIEDIYVKEGDQVTTGQPLVKLDPTALQSNTDAQLAAYQASQNEAQVTRSQVLAAQNQLSQTQQGLNASEASVTTAQQGVASAQQGVASARESVNRARQEIVAAQTDVDRAQVEVNAANRELKRTAELVESGVVSRLEFDQAKDRVENAQVALRNARSRLQSQQIAVKTAQSQAAESQGRVAEAQARVAEARARANQQQVTVKDARRGVDTANYSANASAKRSEQQAAVLSGQRTQRDKTLQVAPINGVIADIPTKVGVFALAGNSTTPLLTIADMSSVNIEVKVDETEIDKVAVGQPAKIKVEAFSGKELVGEVIQKTPLALGKSQTTGGLSVNINVQEAKEFRVVIQLKDVPEDIKSGLRPGMSANATITTKTAENVVAVPIQAVIEKKPDASPSPTIQSDAPEVSDKPKTIKGVFVLDGNKAKFVEVTTGIYGESEVQITGGLSENQEVITGPSRVLNTLKEGAIVKRQVKKEGAETK